MRSAAYRAFVVLVLWASDATAEEPDTLIGSRSQLGTIITVDDDGSPLGNGEASALFGLPTNNDSIAFAITGHPDEGFLGAHAESGPYEVHVDVYDLFGDPIESFSQVQTLMPGSVDEYAFSDTEWVFGTYDVQIDNTVPEPGGPSALVVAVLALLHRRRRPGTRTARGLGVSVDVPPETRPS